MPGPTPELLAEMANSVEFDPAKPEEFVEAHLRTLRIGYGSAHPLPEDKLRRLFLHDIARANDYAKLGNHGLASGHTPAWKHRLGEVKVPLLVIHGTEDALLHVDHGKALVAAVPGAALMLQEGVGHAIPEEEWDTLAGAILRHSA